VKQQKQLDKIKLLKQRYISVFSGKDGAKILEDLEKMCFVNQSTLYLEQPHVMIYREGQRSVLVHIKNMMNFDIKRISELIKLREEDDAT